MEVAWKKKLDDEFRKGREERAEGEYARAEQPASTNEPEKKQTVVDKLFGKSKQPKAATEKKTARIPSLSGYLGVTKSKYRGANPHIKIRF